MTADGSEKNIRSSKRAALEDQDQHKHTTYTKKNTKVLVRGIKTTVSTQHLQKRWSEASDPNKPKNNFENKHLDERSSVWVNLETVVPQEST